MQFSSISLRKQYLICCKKLQVALHQWVWGYWQVKSARAIVGHIDGNRSVWVWNLYQCECFKNGIKQEHLSRWLLGQRWPHAHTMQLEWVVNVHEGEAKLKKGHSPMPKPLLLVDLPQIVSIKLACAIFNCNRSTLYRWEKTNKFFPKRKEFSSRKKGYCRDEIIDYIKSK